MEDGSSDHLSSSLTDLMTSLMVIFVLLLLVFVSHTASKDAAVTDVLLKRLKQDLIPQGFSQELIRPDPRDRNAILVIVPDNLMRFDTQKANVNSNGQGWLKTHIPGLANVLCGAQFRASVDSIVVEGHTDRQPWTGLSVGESQNKNLQLSQQRSMAVVEEALTDLSSQPEEHDCFLQKLSATGRGEQELEATDAQSRRVIFRIRVKASQSEQIERKVAEH
jgi:outer membrane protein OmpA-like peptidoglycan-associated protein